ncbi:MAG: hypothetical protein ACRD2T_03560, partial [Thermoanaerobaculia bacterium]
MNICSVIGLVMGITVILVTASMGGQGLGGFLDLHAFLIVIGGCTSAVILAVNLDDLLGFAGIL